jgi:1,2-diacylglycerol 3-alpha-glucosyltransferase
MRIGMVTAVYKPVVNGVTRMVALLKRELEAAGHEVTIFTFGEPDPAGDEPGVIRSPAIPLGTTGYYFSVRYNRRAQERLRQMDILHCHHLLMGVEMAHRYGACPIVYTNHTRYDLYRTVYVPFPLPAADAIMRQIWREFSDFCDIVVTPSASVQQVMLELGVRRPIRVIGNGIDLADYRRPERPLRKADLGIPAHALLCVYVGRLSVEKNVETLLAQFAIARSVAPDLHLLLVGAGPQTEGLKQQARELDVAPCVHFAGLVDAGNVPNYLAAADLFVTASLSEVHPLTVIEAMAASLPIVGPAAPGLTDLVESGQTGFLTRQVDGGLAAALAALAHNAELRRCLGEEAGRQSEQYDIKQTVSQTVSLYEWLLEKRPDLARSRAHGGWRRQWREKWRVVQPLAEQLGRMIWSPDQALPPKDHHDN